MVTEQMSQREKGDSFPHIQCRDWLLTFYRSIASQWVHLFRCYVCSQMDTTCTHTPIPPFHARGSKLHRELTFSWDHEGSSLRKDAYCMVSRAGRRKSLGPCSGWATGWTGPRTGGICTVWYETNWPIVQATFFFNPHLRTCLLTLEREEGKEGGRKTSVWERQIYRLSPVSAPSRDWTHN